MSWTYDTELLQPLDQIRFLVGDTDASAPLLQDEEIAFIRTQSTGVYGAAASACRAISAKFARRVHEEVGDLKLYNDQMQLQYRELADTLDARAKTYALPTAGGVYASEKEAYSANDELVQPTFSRGMHDYN